MLPWTLHGELALCVEDLYTVLSMRTLPNMEIS